MKKNNIIPLISILVIVAAVLISGYILLGSNKNTVSQNQDVSGLAPMVDGKQVVQMMVTPGKYDPNSFKVKAGVPVRWEITSSGQPGCDSGEVIANGLVDPIFLNPNKGQVTVKEFIPQTAGKYTFSCPMGMVRGNIEVVN